MDLTEDEPSVVWRGHSKIPSEETETPAGLDNGCGVRITGDQQPILANTFADVKTHRADAGERSLAFGPTPSFELPISSLRMLLYQGRTIACAGLLALAWATGPATAGASLKEAELQQRAEVTERVDRVLTGFGAYYRSHYARAARDLLGFFVDHGMEPGRAERVTRRILRTTLRTRTERSGGSALLIRPDEDQDQVMALGAAHTVDGPIQEIRGGVVSMQAGSVAIQSDYAQKTGGHDLSLIAIEGFEDANPPYGALDGPPPESVIGEAWHPSEFCIGYGAAHVMVGFAGSMPAPDIRWGTPSDDLFVERRYSNPDIPAGTIDLETATTSEGVMVDYDAARLTGSTALSLRLSGASGGPVFDQDGRPCGVMKGAIPEWVVLDSWEDGDDMSATRVSEWSLPVFFPMRTVVPELEALLQDLKETSQADKPVTNPQDP